jgi:serine/threonine protein kinase
MIGARITGVSVSFCMICSWVGIFVNEAKLGRIRRSSTALTACLRRCSCTGTGPFYEEGMDQMTLFQCIVAAEYEEPVGVSSAAKDIVAKLLQKEPLQRLGSLSRGEEDILNHSWFRDLDLAAIHGKKAKAPWIPQVKDALDTSCFDDWDDIIDKACEDIPDLSRKDAAMFDKF